MEFFTSDPHFFHEKIATFRGFASLDDMHAEMRIRWNNKIKSTDTVVFLGDIAFSKSAEAVAAMLNSLNGHKVLLKGNHDKGMKPEVEAAFERILDPIANYKATKHLPDGTNEVYHMVLSHFPMLVWEHNERGWIHLHGHMHGMAKYSKPNIKILDVGVDNHPKLVPFSLDEILEIMSTRAYEGFGLH